MYFALWIGPHASRAPWRQAAEAHALRLGLVAKFHDVEQRDGQWAIAAWLTANESAAGPFEIRQDRIEIVPGFQPSGGDLTRVEFCRQTGNLTASAAVVTPEQVVYGEDARGRVIGNDARWLIGWFGLRLNGLAVFSLLQYGFIPPPHTISDTVHRLGSGHALTWPQSGIALTRIHFEARSGEVITDNAAGAVNSTLDVLLAGTSINSALLFSGGVDSTLLAVRLRRLGRTDVQWVNYSFGDDDAEAAHAIRVADALGQTCRQIVHDPAGALGILESVGREYSFPFADFSSIPTNLLIRGAAGFTAPGACLIEGTGADGAFDFAPKHASWERLLSIPAPLRRVVARAYSSLALWRRDSTSRIETFTRLCRRSAQMSMRHAILAQNPLDGIAYHVPMPLRMSLEETIERNVEALSAGLDSITRLSLLDLVQVCAAQFAAKSFDPMRRAGFVPLYPFLDPSMVRLSLRIPWDLKCENDVGKALLKKMVAAEIPSDLVYRRKSGFKPPIERILAQSEIQEFVRGTALSSDGPLLPFINLRVTRAMVDRVSFGQPVGHGVYSYLWALMFVSAWLRQVGA